MGGKNSFARKMVDPLGLTGGRAAWESKFWTGEDGQRRSRPKPKPEDPMLALMRSMQEQQRAQAAASAEAQRQALIRQQEVAGEQAQQMGEQAAQQQLSQFGSIQAIRDANALAAAKQAQASAAEQATGGGFDIGRAREESLANLGVARGMIPATPANLPPSITNPAFAMLPSQRTTRPANVFTPPSYSGIQFGGV